MGISGPGVMQAGTTAAGVLASGSIAHLVQGNIPATAPAWMQGVPAKVLIKLLGGVALRIGVGKVNRKLANGLLAGSIVGAVLTLIKEYGPENLKSYALAGDAGGYSFYDGDLAGLLTSGEDTDWRALNGLTNSVDVFNN